MRVAVISDIHANLPALEAALGAIDTAEVEEIWCLGDVVGYGAQPDGCTELVRERCQVCLVGNHDLAVLGELDISSFSSGAADAVAWTQDHIDSGSLDYLRELEPSGERESIALFHASPRDPVWEYVLSIDQAEDCMDLQPRPVSLIGHSHVALYFNRPAGGGEVGGAQAGDAAALELGEDTWLVNPGSVGQPRDGDPRAAWLELETADGLARYHRVPYDVEAAAGPIVEAGLPKHLAERLYVGH
jgi:diadenosine tetraphosphatase ApaH/serine/threonine PP2A family protein phosphatase